MMDDTQQEACSNQQGLFPVVEEVAVERMGMMDGGVCVSFWEVSCISEHL